MKIHIILLAAGNSRRFGGNKLLHVYKGKPLYSHILETLSRVDISQGERIMVTQYEKVADAGHARGWCVLRNKRPEVGISRSVRMGIQELESRGACHAGDALMFCVCDQPELQAETLIKFIREYERCGKGIGVLAGESVPGNPVIFREDYRKELLGLSGDEGGKTVRKRHPEDVMYFPVSQQEELFDVDDREDLERLEWICQKICGRSPVVVRGGGDLATGVIHRLYRAGYRVLVLETERPACIRRQVSFCEAVYEGAVRVEGVTAVRAEGEKEIASAWKNGNVPVIVDPDGVWIEKLRPEVVVDAILAKKNLGTRTDMAPLTIGLGPGFEAKKDVDIVIETMRGESLGKIYTEGSAIPNTGIPGVIAGYSKERVIHAPAAGRFEPVKEIGDQVEQGEILGWIFSMDKEKTPVYASIPGFLRGMIREGYPVKQGLKIMDIEPRIDNREICFRISDKAVCIADSVYRVIKEYENRQTGR